MQKILSKSPLRISFAGGGTDIREYFSKKKSAVINSTINLYCYCEITFNKKGTVFISLDKGLVESYRQSSSKTKLAIHRACYEYFKSKYNNNKDYNITIKSYSDVPEGSGLGTSSSLTVCILKGLSKCFQINFSKARLAKLAYKIEREMCGISGGVQDFYAASYGGTNLFEFHGNHFKRTKITMPDLFRNEFESSLLVIFLGKSRNSSKIIDSQRESLLKSGRKYMDFMKETVDAVYKVKDTILTSNFDKFHHLINRLWKIKKKFSSEISNSEIDILYKKLRDLGVKSGKLSGAGGGGFMFMFSEFDKKRLLKDYLIKRNISIYNVYLTNDCAESHIYKSR